MRKSVERAQAVQAQTRQATTITQMATQLDRIEAKLDKALSLSVKPEQISPIPFSEPWIGEPEVKAEKPVFKTRVKTPAKA